MVFQYVEAVVSSYMRAMRLEGGFQYKSWENKGFRIVKECIQKLAESLASEIVQQGTQKVSRADAVRWLQRTPTFVKMLEYVFLHLYNYRPTAKNPQEEAISIRRKSIVAESNKLLPFCEGDRLRAWRFVIQYSYISLLSRATICTRLSSIHRYLSNVIH